MLEDYGELPQDIRQRIDTEKDMKRLKSWYKLAARTRSIEEFRVAM